MLVRGRDQADEGLDGPALHHSRRLVGRPGGDVGQSPGRLELDGRTVHEPQEGHELGDQAGADQLVDGGVLVPGQELPAFGTTQ